MSILRNIPSKGSLPFIPSVLSFLTFKHYLLSGIIFFLTALCLPFQSNAQTYTTTGLANSWSNPAAWNCTGGGCKSIPPVKLNGGVKINITDSIYYSGNTIVLQNGQISVLNGGKLVLANGVNIDIQSGGKLQIAEGSMYMVPASYSNVRNQGAIELVKAYLSIGGNFYNAGTVLLDQACLALTDGNFENGASLQGEGNVKVANGNLTNSGSWSPSIAYCASGNLTGNFPGSPSCEAVTEACDCLKDPCPVTNPDILPGYDPTTRNEDIIGSELTALNDDPNNNTNTDIFVLGNSTDVLIDIVYFEGRYNDVVNILSGFGITPADFINNGSNSLVITVFFPIADLLSLNIHTNVINFVRPTPPATSSNNSSLNNQGDFAQESFFARAGFELSGAGIKIGVLSDSYNKSLNNQPATSDITSGVLPGPGNPNGFPDEIQILQDYPFGVASDEGRAMLQILHSVAPGARLAFHSGFVSPGNFAEGIRALANAGCNVITDDITYITEPFFTDVNQGVVAQAVSEVTANNVLYFTSAGNFASRAFDGVFTPGPAGQNQNKHHFASGDFLQKLTLGTGNYLIVLQWLDDFYSIDGGSGAQNDLDFYLADDNGNRIYGFNRNNTGGDPVEVMPFKVINPTTTNLMIERVIGTGNMPFKYIVFKAGDGNNGFSAEYPANSSTIIGHANSSDAITVGAVRYENTPTFGGALQTESFSSTGNPLQPTKPDFTAPNGGNVTVDLGAGDYSGDADNLPNFFGTSAAAPHAAGVAALLLEAQNKYGENFDVRTKLKETAIGYGEPAYRMGAGFISAYNAASSFANPKPELTRLNIDALLEGQNPGEVEFTLVIEGNYFTDQTIVYFRGEALEPIGQTENSISVIIPPFIGNPAIWVQNLPITNNGNDGGADTLFFSDPVLTPVKIKVNESSKIYGETLPTFSFSTEPELAPEYLALLPALIYTTAATDLSDVGVYSVTAAFNLAEGEELAPALRELFEFSFEGNFLTVEKADLTIIPNDLTATYGQALPGITFLYQFGEGMNIPNKPAIQNQLAADHLSSIADDIAVLRNISLANISLANISLANRAFIASYNSLQNISLANISLANGMDIIEVDARLFEDLDQWETGTNFIGNISLANFISLANAQARLNGGEVNSPGELLNISLANISLANISLANISLANFISLANISLANISLANGQTVEDFSLPLRNFISLANNDNTGIATILSQEDASGQGAIPLIPVNLITGLEAGEQYIVPAAFFSNNLSKNFNVRYNVGTLTILPAPIEVKANDANTVYGDAPPSFTVTVTPGLQYDDVAEDLYSGFTIDRPYGPAGTYTITPIAEDHPNYSITVVPGTLTVAKAQLIAAAADAAMTYGGPAPAFTINYTGFRNGDGPEAVTTPPSVLAPTDCSAGVGVYPITLGNDGFAQNYTIVPSSSNGQLTISKAVLTITAVDTFAMFGDPQPVYRYQVSGYICGDTFEEVFSSPTAITLSLDRPFTDPGVYTILVSVSQQPADYLVETVEGTFIYNPDKGFKIQTFADCIVYIGPTSTGFDYLARFSYTNRNEVPYFAEFGPDNTFQGPAAFLGKPLELLQPGGGTFEIPFDGKRIRWAITSYGSTNYTSWTDKNGQPCRSSSNNTEPVSLLPTGATAGSTMPYRVYPNPVSDKLMVEWTTDRLPASEGETSVELYDIVGKLLKVEAKEVIRGQQFELDMAGFESGVYFIKVRTPSDERVLKVIKS